MKRITVVRALAAALAVVVALATVTTTSKHAVRVYAAPGCSNATLNGNYAVIQPAGFTTHNSTTGNEVPWQFAGIAFFDGKGGGTTDYTAAVNGAIFFPNTPTLAYTVSTDTSGNCTGTLSLPAVDYVANIYVVGGGAEVLGVSTSPGDTATFDAKKQ